MAYRSTKRRSTARRSPSRRSTGRRTYRSTTRRGSSRRASGGRAQTLRIVLETHQPSAVQRPEGFMVAAAKVPNRSKF